MPVVPNPVPEWLRPENASVFEPYWRQLLRLAATKGLGADDPVDTAMGAAAAMEVPKTALRHLAPEAMQMLIDFAKRGPIDVHALYALTGSAATLDKQMPALRVLMAKAEDLPLINRAGAGLSKVDVYMRYEEALKQALGDIAPGEDLNRVFGQLWEGTRAFKGQKAQGGPIDILRDKGLLEVGAMLDPVALRKALRQKGWTAPSIAGLFAALGLSLPAATEAGETSEDRPGARNIGAVAGAPDFVQ